jgi:hypothetical protein
VQLILVREHLILIQIQVCQLNNNGTALGPLPGSGKLGGNIDLFAKTSNYLKCLKRALHQKIASRICSFWGLFITIIYLRLLMKT